MLSNSKKLFDEAFLFEDAFEKISSSKKLHQEPYPRRSFLKTLFSSKELLKTVILSKKLFKEALLPEEASQRSSFFAKKLFKEYTNMKASRVLEQISKFMKYNLLHINMSKCCYIHFKPNFECDETCARVRPFANENDKTRAIFINGIQISKVSSTKFLGVIID